MPDALDAWILSPAAYSRLLDGTIVTLQVLAGSVLLGTILALLMGVGRLSKRGWVRAAASVYVEFARGASAIILLFWVFFSLPILFDISLSPMVAGILALGVNMGAYGAEIVRGAVQSVPKGQIEATIALNLTPTQELRYVTLPQAIPIILPPYGNLVIEILKGTSLVSLITLTDLARVMRTLQTSGIMIEDSATTPVLFLNVLLIYFALAQVLTLFFRWAERRSAARFGMSKAKQAKVQRTRAVVPQ